jgi:carbohydrate diacid regulator
MISNLKRIYQDKLIEDVTTYSNDYYYFYKNNSLKKIFGVNKNITHNEYKLLQEMYIEKKIYTLDKNLQKVYEYLLENNTYPFKNKKMKMIMYIVKESDEEVICEFLTNIYKNSFIVKLYNLNICFIEDVQGSIKDIFDALSGDLGYDVILHEGLILNNGYSGSDILSYIKTYHDLEKVNTRVYSDLADFILFQDYNVNKELMLSIKNNLFMPLFNDVVIRDIIQAMLKNDLNVSQTAKLLYMNRNSLINKLDYIYKETGLNLQKYTHACVIYVMINL